MTRRLSVLLRRAKQICRTEGLIPLVRRGFTFVVRRFFLYESCYLTQNDLSIVGNEANVLRSMPDFTVNPTFKIVATNQEADELEAEGLEFRPRAVNARERLDKGAIAFCLFVGQELASILWVGMTQRAKDALKEPPYQVDFSKGEVCLGDQWTSPKYRGMGLAPYVDFKAAQFVDERGKVSERSVGRTSNIPSKRAYTKLGPNIRAEARYLKILWWKSWKEKPLTPASNGSSGY